MDEIDMIFKKLDDYVGEKSFDRLSITQIKDLIKDFANTRRTRVDLDMPKDEKLLELEKELRNLRARLINNNQVMVYR
jgi:hypothetical protein